MNYIKHKKSFKISEIFIFNRKYAFIYLFLKLQTKINFILYLILEF